MIMCKQFASCVTVHIYRLFYLLPYTILIIYIESLRINLFYLIMTNAQNIITSIIAYLKFTNILASLSSTVFKQGNFDIFVITELEFFVKNI